jgi:hypothetical protein
MTYRGILRKMTVSHSSPVSYTLMLDKAVEMNALIGKSLSVQWLQRISCVRCGKDTSKSYGEGFCFPCFESAPESSPCIIRPELCRAHLGEGRDVVWEDTHHNCPHVVYLVAGDVVKVGVTRATQIPTRWIDQGATRAIICAETSNRFEAGQLEVALKEFFTDKTSWQKMLKNVLDESIDLSDEKWRVFDELPSDLRNFFSEDDQVTEMQYPVSAYPIKLQSVNLEKQNRLEGKLEGIKGQYLIFSGGIVCNIRRHTGFEVELSVH